MSRFLLSVLLIFFINVAALANPNSYDMIYNNHQVAYSPLQNNWSVDSSDDDRIILTKKLFEGAGSYSIYNYPEGEMAFALSTGCEFIKEGKLIVVDNDLLKFSKVIYDETNKFVQVPLTEDEIREVFSDAEIFKISTLDSDNKVWLHKPFLKKKTILLYNDTNRYFHRITCKSKGIQDDNIKGLITFPRYGFFRFTHFGERDGKLIFYIR